MLQESETPNTSLSQRLLRLRVRAAIAGSRTLCVAVAQFLVVRPLAP